MTSSSYSIDYYITKGFTLEEATNKVQDNKLKTSSGSKLNYAKKRLLKYNCNLTPTELLEWESKLTSCNNLGSGIINIYNIVDRLLQENDFILEECFNKIFEASTRFTLVKTLLNNTESVKYLFGENSIYYKNKLNYNKSYASCSFDKFSESYIDKNQARIDFNEKYGSGVESLKKRHNINDVDAIKIVTERSAKIRTTFLSKPEEEQKARYMKSANTLENSIRRFGIELGTIKFYEYCKNQSRDLAYYIKTYGEIEGQILYSQRYSRKNQYCCKEYWINKGMTEEESIDKLKSIFKGRPNFSLDYCNDKYGSIKGYQVWKARQELWQSTLKAKPQEEIDDINRRKGCTLENFINRYGEVDGTIKFNNWLKTFQCGCSKASRNFFVPIYKKLRKLGVIEQGEVYFGIKGSREFKLKYNDGNRFYDFTIPKLNIIVEFNGIVFHPRENDVSWKSAFGQSYEIAYNNDRIKEKLAIDNGYDIFYVWEDEDLQQKQQELILKILDVYTEKN